jgi:hypothetical protein
MPDPATDTAGRALPLGNNELIERLTSPEAIDSAADRIVTARVLTAIANNAKGKPLSLTGKMQALTERALDFHKKTEGVLDGISEKIVKAEHKRDIAAEKHHDYYDSIIAGVDDSIKAIERLSNVPLHEGGED